MGEKIETEDRKLVTCPFCRTEGDMSDQLAPEQRRCSNESCRVVTYMEDQV